MAEREGLVRCPLCEGQGAISPQAVVDRFLNPELRQRLDARITEIAEICASGVAKGKVLDFQKEVHTWNPALPIWRRSPKE
ncbi:MAG: hypothetical protein ACRD3Q_06065 [Terriglobales bacterium]